MFMETHQSYILDTNNLQAIKINFSVNLHPGRNENHQYMII